MLVGAVDVDVVLAFVVVAAKEVVVVFTVNTLLVVVEVLILELLVVVEVLTLELLMVVEVLALELLVVVVFDVVVDDRDVVDVVVLVPVLAPPVTDPEAWYTPRPTPDPT